MFNRILNTGRKPEIFYGRAVFKELRHFDEQSCKTRERKVPQKKSAVFLLETLKNCILNEKFNP